MAPATRGLLAFLLVALAGPAFAEDPYLAVDAGFDGVAVRGGVVPLRFTVRTPPDPVAPGFWRVRVRPLGGPLPWDLVLPFPELPGESLVLDSAIAVHPDVETLEFFLEDSEGRARVHRVLRPAWVSDGSPLGLFVSYERGLRRHADSVGGESLWLRLPVERLPNLVVGLLDVDAIAGIDPDAGSARLRQVVQEWRSHLGGVLVPGSPDALRGVGRLGFTEMRQVERPEVPNRLVLLLAVSGLLILTAALAVADRRRRGLWGSIALGLGIWTGLGWPTRIDGQLEGILLGSEVRPSGVGTAWDLRTLTPGLRAGRPVVWPTPVDLVAPVELSAGLWEAWAWGPGTGEPRWEIRGPRRRSSGTWAGWGLDSAAGAASAPAGAPPHPQQWQLPGATVGWEGTEPPRFHVRWPEGR